MIGAAAPPGAHCAIHPDLPASAICARCGSFMCQSCTGGGSAGRCPRCVAVTGVADFALRRDTWTVGAVLSTSFEAFKREGLVLTLAGLIYIVVSAIPNVFTELFEGMGRPVVGAVLSLSASLVFGFLTFVVAGGFAVLAERVLRGQKAEVGLVFSELPKLWLYARAMLATMVVAIPVVIAALIPFVAVGALAGGGELPGRAMAAAPVAVVLAAAAGFYFGLPTMFVAAEVALGRADGGWAALMRCFALVKGLRWRIFGVLLAGTLALLVGLLAICVGVVPAVGFFNLLVVTTYLALRNAPSALGGG